MSDVTKLLNLIAQYSSEYDNPVQDYTFRASLRRMIFQEADRLRAHPTEQPDKERKENG